MSDKEKKVAEQRTIEAMRKGYIGMAGKFGVISKYLGDKIREQDDVPFSENTNWMENDDPADIPYMWDGDPDLIAEPTGKDWKERNYDIGMTSVRIIGSHFDGLNRGMHLEITCIDETIRVLFEGRRVYEEIAGQLTSFCPEEAWEEKISSLYKVAKKIERDTIVKEKEAKKTIAVKNKAVWLKDMQERWGL